MIFAPITQADLVIGVLPFQDTLDQIGVADRFINIRIEDKDYRVNMGASRLLVLKKNPVCCCCGIRATEASLDLDAQNTKESGCNKYHVNFYARTCDPRGSIHLTLMTRDHIVSRFHGGSDSEDNAQTLCYNCNCLKSNANLNLEQMRKVLFPAYRAYASSRVLNRAKTALEPVRVKIEKARRTVVNITKALEMVKDERAVVMKEKIEQAEQEIVLLTRYIEKVELEAQTTGQVPDILL